MRNEVEGKEKPKGPESTPDSSAPAGDVLEKGADAVIKEGLSGWWEARTENEKAATALIGAALAIGPLGQGFLAMFGALFGKGSIPGSTQVEAVFWLLLITAPLAVFVIVAVSAFGHGPVLGVLAFAAVASVVVGGFMRYIDVPESLAGVYCYADVSSSGGVVYEEQCREFNNAGFYADNAQIVGNRSASPQIFASALAYTIDARGFLMAMASIMAGIGIGILIREHNPP